MTKKRLKLVKPDKQIAANHFPSEESIDRAFLSIRNSPRYGVLRNLHISGVLNTKLASKYFGKKTVSDVVEDSAKSLLKINKIPCRLVEDLLSFIKSVSETNGNEFREHNSINHNTSNNELLNELAPIEATQQLEKAINNLRSSHNFGIISHQLVGSFWDEVWPRAPFEESLTIRQLCSLDVAKILRKRSLTPPKVGALIAALERAIATIESDIKQTATINTNKTDHSPSSGELIDIINHNAPTLIPQLKTNLSTAGMTSEHIKKYISDNLQDNLITILSQLILEKIGACHPQIRGIELQSVWTINKYFIETVMVGLWAQLPLSKEHVNKQLSVLLPNIDLKIIHEIFSIGAIYIVEKEQWELK